MGGFGMNVSVCFVLLFTTQLTWKSTKECSENM